MPTISSLNWNLALDLCSKHYSHLPCPECLATQDKGIRVKLTMDDVNRPGCGKKSPIKDMFTPEQEWIYERMIN